MQAAAATAAAAAAAHKHTHTHTHACMRARTHARAHTNTITHAHTKRAFMNMALCIWLYASGFTALCLYAYGFMEDLHKGSSRLRNVTSSYTSCHITCTKAAADSGMSTEIVLTPSWCAIVCSPSTETKENKRKNLRKKNFDTHTHTLSPSVCVCVVTSFFLSLSRARARSVDLIE